MKSSLEWEQCWLNYRPCSRNAIYFQTISLEGCSISSSIISNAVEELINASTKMFGTSISLTERRGTLVFAVDVGLDVTEDGFTLEASSGTCIVTAKEDRGILHGMFHMLRIVMSGGLLDETSIVQRPDMKLRMLDHWDNMDGSIERGYSGKSFFFREGEVIVDERTRDYARLISSVGINAVVINNVNVKKDAAYLVTAAHAAKLAVLSMILSGYGIKLFLSINFASPIIIGGLDTADPASEKVSSWWKRVFDNLFASVPELGGIMVKADSEGAPGPFSYGRDHAYGANMLADAVLKHGALVIWRCFVYDCQQDWRDRTSDRAKAAFETFMPIDGRFRSNVVLQIKNGPMDFQVREPVSPLFGGLTRTNQIMEVQIAQEYTGQQIDVCYLVPLFAEILASRTFCSSTSDSVRDILAGRAFPMDWSGIAAVANTGDGIMWTGSDLAAANLYGFGRLAFDPDLSPQEIAVEWTVQTFGEDFDVVTKLAKILMRSWETYEKYTTPYGIGWMVTPGSHYGPSVDGYEYSRWGTYHRADHMSIGVDRTSTGTGYTAQYQPKKKLLYDDIRTCPEELLLFFHRVPYTYVMKNGRTLLQNWYDAHFEGVSEVETMIAEFKTLQTKLPVPVFKRISKRFDMQLSNAVEWRDHVSAYFFRKSGIPDVLGRQIY
ncbi:alpha-glucuronidase [Mesotoga sp.]|jgi:alpha-glucuronidase|uniref:alpha-glucuronidase n=1 Tax=Mesotoga sp. TaxID=2053577 RepID=UPI000A8BBD16